MRAYARSGQYHTIVESRVRLTWYQSHALNLVMSIESSNVEQLTPRIFKCRTKDSKRKGVEPRSRGAYFVRGEVLDESPTSANLTMGNV